MPNDTLPPEVGTMNAHSIVKAEELLAGYPLPAPLRRTLEADLRDAVDRGFHIDLEQLGAADGARPMLVEPA